MANPLQVGELCRVAEREGELLTGGNLTNNIHKIFTRGKFVDGIDLDYDALVPSLRLVSRLLETKPVEHYLCAVSMRRLTDLPPLDDTGRRYQQIHPRRDMDEAHPHNAKVARKVLHDLRHMVKFYVSWRARDELRGHTQPLTREKTLQRMSAKKGRAYHERGVGSDIMLDETLYATILASKRNPGVLSQQMVNTSIFCLAVNILFELGHAVENAVMEPGLPSPFFGKYKVNDPGHTIIHRLFGGAVFSYPDDDRVHIVTWPNAPNTQLLIDEHKGASRDKNIWAKTRSSGYIHPDYVAASLHEWYWQAVSFLSHKNPLTVRPEIEWTTIDEPQQLREEYLADRKSRREHQKHLENQKSEAKENAAKLQEDALKAAYKLDFRSMTFDDFVGEPYRQFFAASKAARELLWQKNADYHHSCEDLAKLDRAKQLLQDLDKAHAVYWDERYRREAVENARLKSKVGEGWKHAQNVLKKKMKTKQNRAQEEDEDDAEDEED